MSPERTVPPPPDCPQDVLGWIPWYPDGLEEAQRGAVEAHAAGCEACRHEIAFLQGQEEPSAPAPDPERVYARVLARMESSRADGGSRHEGEPPRDARHEARTPRPTRGWRRIEPVRAAALAASVLLALVAGVLLGPLLRGERATPPVYRTASDTGAPTAADGSPDAVRLDVVFRGDARAAQIQQALRVIGARITSGPSQLGVYRLELGARVDVAAAKKLLTGDRDGVPGVASFAEEALRPAGATEEALRP